MTDEAETLEVVAPPEKAAPKKRGRPKGKKVRPKSEYLNLKYPPDKRKLCFYTEKFKHKGTMIAEEEGEVGAGVFYNYDLGPHLVLYNFHELRDGSLIWYPRPVRNANGGPVIMHHDMITIPMSMANEFADKIKEAVNEWGGGQKKVDEWREDYQERKREQKHEDTLDEKFKKFGDTW